MSKVIATAQPNGHERAKDFLTTNEMEALLEALKGGRHGVRDCLLALMTYRHGLRVSEAVGLRRDEINLDQAGLWVRRLKNGLSVEQPIAGDELRAIKRSFGSRSDALPLNAHSNGPTFAHQNGPSECAWLSEKEAVLTAARIRA
jgi:integrase